MTRNTWSRDGARFALAGAILLAALLPGCKRESAETKTPPVAVRIAPVRTVPLQRTLDYLGTVAPVRQVMLAARVQGTVAGLGAEEGEPVAEGRDLAVLHAPDLEAAVARLRADHDYWSRRRDEDEGLAARGAVSQDQLAASERASAAAAAALAEAEARLGWTRERSPFAGTVLEWRVEAGQHVLPGQALVLLGGMEIEVEVPVVAEDLRAGIEVGIPAFLTGPESGTITTAVDEVAPAATGRGRTFAVTLRVPAEAGADWRPGEPVRVRFALEESTGGAAVPSRAIAGRTEGNWIFLIEDGIARRWKVTTGLEVDGWVSIAPAPPQGSFVAVTNLDRLSDGVAVFSVTQEAGS
ncbi:efflux RND transporter periplasmic adaptor subunit [bacterium]|nr:efflux RND transporter periplasmic adaptor subunit [bacterium]